MGVNKRADTSRSNFTKFDNKWKIKDEKFSFRHLKKGRTLSQKFQHKDNKLRLKENVSLKKPQETELCFIKSTSAQETSTQNSLRAKISTWVFVF